ncbi:MAG: hypothetical protein IT236_14220 [Bacteroidia bacterium]|nr:hypothetical protein [Bacteroidia bacterium]
MFAGLLNKGLRGSLVLLAAIFVLTFLASYLSLVSIEQDNYPNLFYNYFSGTIQSKILVTLLNYLFIGLGVFLISLIAVNQEVVEKQNYFPVFLYLLLSAACVHPSNLTPQILTNIFILFSVYKLLDSYRKDDVLKNIFDAALWLCVSFYFSASSIIFFPFFFIVLFILRPFYWREWVIALLGFVTPVYIYECMAYLSNFNRWYLFESAQLYFSSIKIPVLSEYYLLLTLSLLLLLFVSLAHALTRGFGNKVKKQRSKSILLWYLFFASLSLFSGGANGSVIIASFAFPLSFFIGDFLYNMKQIKIANTLLAVLLLGVLIVFLAQFGAI